MNNLTNSIVRGFGMTLGRKAANRVTRGSQKVESDKNYLTFWEGIKTILFIFPTMGIMFIVVYIFDFFIHGNEVLNKTHPLHINWIIVLTLLGTFSIGYDYYKKVN